MQLTNYGIKQIKKLFICLAKSKSNPMQKHTIELLQAEIDFNFKLYEIESQEQFAKDNSFCVDCGCSLNPDNECPGCGRAYGW